MKTANTAKHHRMSLRRIRSQRWIVRTMFAVVALPILLGACVTTQMLMPGLTMMPRGEQLFIEGRYQEAINYMTGPQGKLENHEKKRILNEGLHKIAANQPLGLDFLTYLSDYQRLTQSFIELGQFDRAEAAYDEGIRVMTAVMVTYKRSKDPHKSDSDYIANAARRLNRLKGYIVWFRTGNKASASKYFDLSVPVVSSSTGSIGAFDLSEKQRLYFLIDSGCFSDKIEAKYEKALDQFNEVVNLSNKLGFLNIDEKYAYSLLAYGHLVSLYMKLGRLEDAKNASDKYNQLTDETIFKMGKFIVGKGSIFRGFLSSADSMAGALYALLGDFARSEEYFKKSLNLLQGVDARSALGDREALGAYFVLYGRFYLGMRDRYAEAAESVDKGIQWLTPGYVNSVQGDLDLETAYIYSAELHFLQKEYDKSHRQANSAIQFSRRYRNKVGEATAYVLLGQIALERKDLGSAKHAYEAAQELVENVDSTEKWKLYYGLGQVYEGLGKQGEALDKYQRAVQEVEKLWQGRFKDTAKQVSFIDNRLVTFEPVIRILAENARGEKAVDYIEHSKSRAFFESKLYDSASGVAAGNKLTIAEDDSNRMQKLGEEITSLSDRIAQLSSEIESIDNDLKGWNAPLSSAGAKGSKKEKQAAERTKAVLSQAKKKRSERTKEEHLRERKICENRLQMLIAQEAALIDRHRGTLGKLIAQNPLPIRQIQRLLPPGFAILEYYVGDDAVIGAIIDRRQIYAKRLSIVPKALNKAVLSFRKTIEKRLSDYQGQGIQLFEALVRPFEKQLGENNVICVIPHGVLHYLPFNALVVDDSITHGTLQRPIQQRNAPPALPEKAGDGVGGVRIPRSLTNTGQRQNTERASSNVQLPGEPPQGRIDAKRPVFLIEKYTLFYAPSATILCAVHMSSNSNRKKLVAFGSPPEVRMKDPESNDVVVFEKLKNAKTEVEEVAGLFSDRLVALDEAATETSAKTNSPKADVLLFSTHGRLMREHPLESFIVLNRDGANDGRLTVKDIEQSKLWANLVVLSACETGLAAGYAGLSDNIENMRFPYGDDLVGLQRAFLKRGSASVLSTLWEVSDKSTARLVAEFFRHYVDGEDKPIALKKAEIAVMNHNLHWRHPYFWAPFVLSGDWK